MNSGNITDQLLDAIEVIVDSAVSKAGYDKTVQAIVSKCVTASEGKYSVKYQGGYFYAYSQDPSITFNKGDSVYVLIPGNDMNKTKTILGTVEKLGIDYVATEESAKYEYVGNNLITTFNDYSFGLCSNKVTDEDVLYDYSTGYLDPHFQINLEGANIYIKNSDYLMMAAHFRTTLAQENRAKGNYGLEYILAFENPANPSQEILRTYTLDIDQMFGDPYDLPVATREYCVFDIDGEHFKRIQKIRVFSKDFVSFEGTSLIDDIFITNIEMGGGIAVPVDPDSGCSLTMLAKQGLYFESDESVTATRRIEAEIRKNGKVQNPTRIDAVYYWFKENSGITYTSLDYVKYGGQGWQCLNEYEDIVDEHGTIVKRVFKEGTNTYNVLKSLASSKENKFKCVAVYSKDIILSREFVIFNQSSVYNITITSDLKDNKFNSNLHIANITCSVEGVETGHTLSFAWTKRIDDNAFNALAANTNILTNEELNYAIKYIYYRCTVTDTTDNKVLGTALLKLNFGSSDDEIDFDVYHLVLENEGQVFKYDENGFSPKISDISHPLIILPLKFILYDDKGNAITPAEIGASNITWKVARNKTLIEVVGEDTPEIIDDYNYYHTEELSFTIRDMFKRDYMNNIIELTVLYDNKQIKAQTNFSFLKDGDIGSNGTDYVCRIVPNPINRAEMPEKVIWTYNPNMLPPFDQLNYTYNTKPFRTILYLNGDIIYDDADPDGTWPIAENLDCKYSVQKNIYPDEAVDPSNFTIAENGTSLIRLGNDATAHTADIIKSEIKYYYNGKSDTTHYNTYYATIPINFVKYNSNEGYSVEIDPEGGFDTVVYRNDGCGPQYDSTNPFKIKLLDENLIDITQNEEVSFTWIIKGQCHLGEWKSFQNLSNVSMLGTNKGTQKIKPANEINGYCVSNAIYCAVRVGGLIKAEIHLPIQMYLNRYGNPATNTWDGQTISLDEENGVILAPQVGAGTKNEDNSFTGVFMGSVVQQGNDDVQTGLFGYESGTRTFELNAEDGSAKFGTSGSGQIIIDPNDGNEGHAYLRSGDFNLVYERVSSTAKYNDIDLYFRKNGDIYTELKKGIDYEIDDIIAESNIYKAAEGGSGMEIDLTDPHIRFGSGKFRVDFDGSVHATEYALASSVDNIKESVEEIQETISLFEIQEAASAISIPCDALHLPITSLDFPIEYHATFKGEPLQIIEGDGIGLCKITVENRHQGVLLIKNFDNSHQEIRIQTDSLIPISDLLNNYIIKFEYRQNADTVHTVEKQLNITLAQQGADGQPGEQGPAGPAGKDGTSVTVKGSFNTLQELVAEVIAGRITPEAGDSYIIDRDLYVFTNEGGGHGTIAADWKNVGQFKGLDAKRCFIVASTEIFRSDDGGVTYSPNQSVLTPFFQSVEYTHWSYSTQGGAAGTFIGLSGVLPSGITINSSTKALTITNNCELFNSNQTLVFKCDTDDANVYDTISVSKIKNGLNGPKGDTGADGIPALSIISGNEAAVLPCDLKWTLLEDIYITIPFAGFWGVNKQSTIITKINDITTITPGTKIINEGDHGEYGISISAYTAATASSDGLLTLKFIRGSWLNDLKNDAIKIYYQCNGTLFEKQFAWAKTLDPNLTVGGRNLILKTSKGWQETEVSSTFGEIPFVNTDQVLDFCGLNVGDKYVVRCKFRTNSGKKLRLGMQFWNSDSDKITIYSDDYVQHVETTGETEGYAYVIDTFTAEELSYNQMKIIIDSSLTAEEITTDSIEEYAELKLERGDTYSDWSPAPEDVIEDLSIANEMIDAVKGTIQGIQENDLKEIRDELIKKQDSLDGLNSILDGLKSNLQENAVKSINFEYTVVTYQYTQAAKGSDFSSTAIYYSKDSNNIYTKVRPEVDNNNKLLGAYWVKGDLSTISENPEIFSVKPQWEDGKRIYQRTVTTYNNGTVTTGSWNLLDDYQSVDDRRYLDAQSIIDEMRGGNSYIHYDKTGFYCYNNASESNSTNRIVINNEGILFGKKINGAWTDSSVWTIDGTFDAQNINVKNLAADAIINGILTIGSTAQDGGMIINDDAGVTHLELNSQRFLCRLNNGGYILIGKDVGFQILSSSNKVQHGSALTWSSVTGNGTLKYENNKNYYTTQGDFLSLIIPEKADQVIPSGTTVYTVSSGNIFEMQQQKINESIIFGSYIQTVNINTTDSSGKVHRGIGFIAQ